MTTLLQLNQVPTSALIQQYYETLWNEQVCFFIEWKFQSDDCKF